MNTPATPNPANPDTAVVEQNAGLFYTALYSLIALAALCVAWEWFLAPLRPGGSWLILKVLPLLPAIAGVWKRKLYTMQWLSMLVLLYFMEGVIRATDKGGVAPLAWAETALSVVCFVACIAFLRPYKRAAKARLKAQKSADAEAKQA